MEVWKVSFIWHFRGNVGLTYSQIHTFKCLLQCHWAAGRQAVSDATARSWRPQCAIWSPACSSETDGTQLVSSMGSDKKVENIGALTVISLFKSSLKYGDGWNSLLRKHAERASNSKGLFILHIVQFQVHFDGIFFCRLFCNLHLSCSYHRERR